MSSYTNEQLAALKKAVARGVKSVSYNGETVTYHSIDEMLKLIAAMERELKPGNRIHYPTFERGT